MPTQQELKQQGNIHFQNGDFKKAIEFYTLAIEQDAFCDEAAPILSNRSLCYFNIRKYKEAYEDAGCCCGIRPDWAKGFARRGFAAEKLGEWQIALESYDEYLKLDKSDEMEVKKKRNLIKKTVDANAIAERKTAQELRELDEKLSRMTSTDAAQKALEEGCQEMNLEKLEIAIKHGADFSKKAPSLGNPIVDAFPKNSFMATMTKNWGTTLTDMLQSASTSTSTAALRCLSMRSLAELDDEYGRRMLVLKQRQYLDRLLDLVKEQKQPYVPEDSMINEVNLLLDGNNDFPVRKDFFLLLLEKGKKYFVKDEVSTRTYRIALLHRLLNAETSRKVLEVSNDAPVPASGEHLRNLRECVDMVVSGLSKEDVDSLPTLGTGKLFDIDQSALESSITCANSAEIAELLLRRGADPNQAAVGASKARGASIIPRNFTLLDISILRGHYACARVLLAYGAKLKQTEIPEWVLSSYHDEKFSAALSVLEPSASSSSSSPSCSSVSTSSLTTSAACESKKFSYLFFEKVMDNWIKKEMIVDEDLVRLLFDAITEQNLGFIFSRTDLKGKEAWVMSPLSYGIWKMMSVRCLKIMIKVRPQLAGMTILYTRCFGDDDSNVPSDASLSGPLSWVLFSVKAAKEPNTAYYKDVMKLVYNALGEDHFEKAHMTELFDGAVKGVPSANRKCFLELQKFCKTLSSK